MEEVLISISLIMGLSALLTILARLVKQPPIVAYLFAGILAGPLFFNILNAGDSSQTIQTFAHIGVAFLLYIVGLSLDLRVLKELGKVSVFAGIFEIIITSGIGLLIAIGLGFQSTTALYIAIGLAFSSTVVVVKILSDKKEIDTLHGKIALGILIVEDFVAAIALMAIPIINSGKSFTIVFKELGLIIGLIIVVFLLATFFINKFLNYLARSQETLFLFGIGYALILAMIFENLGFSIEMGALIAGMSLASSKYTLELGGKIKPLRDFFVVLFFVYFGSQLIGPISFEMIKMAILFSLFIVVGKPIIVMSVLRVCGYKKRTNFLTGISLAQISEFSLIIMLLGFKLGIITQEVMSLIVLISIITIGLSSYTIHYSHTLFNKISKVLHIFEGDEKEEKKKESFKIILFGYHRLGYKILQALKETKIPFVVVDYNPKVILSLEKEGVNCIYGDAADKELLEEINFEKAELVISTIPDLNSNLTIQERLDKLGSTIPFIATSEQPRDAIELYKKGVDYVIVPHHLGGDYASSLIREFRIDKKKYLDKGKQHLRELEKAKGNSAFTS